MRYLKSFENFTPIDDEISLMNQPVNKEITEEEIKELEKEQEKTIKAKPRIYKNGKEPKKVAE